MKVPGGDIPFAGVRIQLRKSGVPVQEMFLRDARFEFYNVAEGRYTLVAVAAGYETITQEIEVPGGPEEIVFHARRTSERAAVAVRLSDLRVPKAARKQFEAAKSKLLQNDCVGAFDYLKKAINAYSEYGVAHYALGECYALSNQFEAAEKEFKRALEQPHKAELHLELAKVYMHKGNKASLARQIELFAEEGGRLRSRE